MSDDLATTADPARAAPSPPQIHERDVTLATFERGVVGVLRQLVGDPGRWIVIADVAASDGRYVQFLCMEDRRCHAEVSSNASLRGAHALTAADEAALVEDGWSPPEPHLPNFWRDGGIEAVPALADATSRVLRRVFQVDDGDVLWLKLFRSALDYPPARHPVKT